MPTLNWIGKEAIVKHNKDVPFRLLEPVPELCCADNHGRDSGNLIVQGDNLHALKGLLPRYAGQVKCIYIDPLYNTGNEGWIYNDNVNSHLDLAEDRAKRKIPMTMEDWAKRLDAFLEFTDRDILQTAGKVSAEMAKTHAQSEFEKYRIVQDRMFESDFDRAIRRIEVGE